jgi:hypothetical protein
MLCVNQAFHFSAGYSTCSRGRRQQTGSHRVRCYSWDKTKWNDNYVGNLAPRTCSYRDIVFMGETCFHLQFTEVYVNDVMTAQHAKTWCRKVQCVSNVLAHAQKPDFVFRRNGWVHLNRQGSQFSRLLTYELCASAVVILDTPCSEVVWRVLVKHSIRQFPLHFPARASPCAITIQLDSTLWRWSYQ